MILRVEQQKLRGKPSSVMHVVKHEAKGKTEWDYLNNKFIEEADLPEWVRNKLAVLSMRDFSWPLEDIPGVGVRTGRYIYLIYTDDEGIDNGDDA
jgi:hypothetical protein